MSIFKGRDEELDDEELVARRKRKDLSAGRQGPAKPWGKRERIIILTIFASSVLLSGFLAASARNFKLPGLPRLKLSLPKFNFLKGETIIVGKKKIDKTEKIKSEFVQKTKNLSGVYALYVIDLETGFSFGVNENEVMQAASLIKLPLMLSAEGKVSDAKIAALGKRSDNAVFNELVQKFGLENLQKYLADLGMQKTSLAENKTTPQEIGELFQKIYTNKNEKILGFLTDTIFENWLRAGIPPEVRVAHKYGRETHVVNDAGIVFSDRPFVLVIMSDGVVEREADEIFPELARLVYLGLAGRDVFF